MFADAAKNVASHSHGVSVWYTHHVGARDPPASSSAAWDLLSAPGIPERAEACRQMNRSPASPRGLLWRFTPHMLPRRRPTSPTWTGAPCCPSPTAMSSALLPHSLSQTHHGQCHILSATDCSLKAGLQAPRLAPVKQCLLRQLTICGAVQAQRAQQDHKEDARDLEQAVPQMGPGLQVPGGRPAPSAPPTLDGPAAALLPTDAMCCGKARMCRA